MKKLYLIFGALICTLVMISCDSKTNEQKISEITVKENTFTFTIGNPTPEEILKNDENADIFFIDGVVYRNAEDMEWVMEQSLTLGNKLGEIRKNTSNSNEFFESFTATKLSIGTVIYTPVEKQGSTIKIVIVDNKEMRYIGLIEG